jgi:hypothetical protein
LVKYTKKGKKLFLENVKKLKCSLAVLTV